MRQFCIVYVLYFKIKSLIQFNNEEARDGQSIVNMCKEYFSSVYTSSLPNPNSKHNFPNSISNICNIDISLINIFNELDNLNINLCPGPDNISPKFLYNCRFILSYPIHYLFKQSLSSGTFPSYFKTVYISALFKKGDRSSVLNYRPISKISIIPKIFTKIINDKLFPILKNIIINEQHGFLTKRSTITNLATFKQTIFESFSINAQTDLVYTDFKKAFDRIDHNLLISKLKGYGIQDPLLSWFSSFLTERFQIVKFNNYFSNLISITSGVPQGDHISPLVMNKPRPRLWQYWS